MQLDVNGGEADVYKTSPWRAPGTAPVFGSGCGVAGGSDTVYMNGGTAPKGVDQGFDGLNMPATEQTVWPRGSNQEVAWGISANHAGGYTYRLCNLDEEISEECFTRTPLNFHGNTSWIVYDDGKKVEFPSTIVTEGVYPEGSQWMKDPIPGCYICDAYEKCGAPMEPVPGYDYNSPWNQQVSCYGACAGTATTENDGSCGKYPTYYEAKATVNGDAITGFKGNDVTENNPKGGYWGWSIQDLVEVPQDIAPGNYLLSWRWDCEESTQVWQNCADIEIV